MELEFAHGKQGGLVDPAPVADPGRPGAQRRALSSEDRAVFAAGLEEGLPQARIARMIGRDPSVVSREIRRNTGIDGRYRAAVAHRAAARLRRRPKVFKLVANPALCRRIKAWMDQGWSPRLMAMVLEAEHGADHTERVSHETIYQALYVQTRGALRADLHRQLSLKRPRRVPRTRDRRANSPYREAFRVSQRPAEVPDRAIPGHWEELAGYERVQIALQTPVFFCDPYSPWQRGTNENTNRLLRFWFEKGSDLSVHTPEDLKRVADLLNQRPRPTLGLQTPANKLNELLTQAA